VGGAGLGPVHGVGEVCACVDVDVAGGAGGVEGRTARPLQGQGAEVVPFQLRDGGSVVMQAHEVQEICGCCCCQQQGQQVAAVVWHADAEGGHSGGGGVFESARAARRLWGCAAVLKGMRVCARGFVQLRVWVCKCG